MLEIKNRLYTQRFFANKTPLSDLFKAVTYTQFEGDIERVPFWYKVIPGETSTLDLTRSENDIFMAIKSNTRNEIKRAEKEGIIFEYNYDYYSFVPYYNDFCKSKGLEELINSKTLEKYDKTIITIARHNDKVLSMHATVVNLKEKVAMLLFSCSTRLNDNDNKKMIGWGNRYLHYQEFLLFKEWGIERYEWNGVCTNPEEIAKYNISQFKLSFGCIPKNSIGLRTPVFLLLKKMQAVINKIPKIRNFVKVSEFVM